MQEKKYPLEDLSFFKFPALTTEVVQNIVLLFVLIAVTVILTLIAQRFVNRWQSSTYHRKSLQKKSHGEGLSRKQKDLLERLLRASKASSSEMLLADAEAYEEAVARFLPTASEEEADELGALRRVFHLNVMNSNLQFVSTRQLLPDLPMRLITTVGGERLDLYCSLLDLDEQYLYFDLNYGEEVFGLLESNPDVLLIHWHEERGETGFKLQLEKVTVGEGTPIFRVAHTFRDAEVGQRTDFRLSLDLALHYSYFQRESLRRVRLAKGGQAAGQSGEGRLVDLSFGGAAFLAQSPLAPNGFAQLKFEIRKRPARIMLEVLSSLRYSNGTALVRGRLRGTQEESRTLLNNFLSYEQIKRLREKGAFRFKPET
ncbi:MAG: PilZ domain-containing protein [SAR324 cluster bacterium]|nr:PilZ domain-containing protein [SAR324 cluster bacterium]